MATITSAATGDWNSTATWVGSVVPVLGDRAIIAAGHVVTVNGTYSAGDDTSTGIQVNGTLKASRLVSSKITVRGDLFIGTTGTLDYGTEADPIPSSVVAEIEINDSASKAHNKWGIRTDDLVSDWAGFRVWGASKTHLAAATATATSSDDTLTLDDVTGWEVGDWCIFECTTTDTNTTNQFWRTISSIAGNNVTFNANLANATHIGRKVGNLSRNVKIYGKNGNSYRSHISVRHKSNYSITNSIEIGPCEIRLTGGSSNAWQIGGLSIHFSSSATAIASVKNIEGPVMHDLFSLSGSTPTSLAAGTAVLLTFSNQATPITISEMFISIRNAQNAIALNSGAQTNFVNLYILKAQRAFQSGFSQGAVNSSCRGGYFSGMNSIIEGSGIKMALYDVTVENIDKLSNGNTSAFGSLSFTNCSIGDTLALLSTTDQIIGYTGGFADITYDECSLSTGLCTIDRASSNLDEVSPGWKWKFRNLDNDPYKNQIFYRWGEQRLDESVMLKGTTSIRSEVLYSGIPASIDIPIAATASEVIKLIFFLRFNTDYGTATPPVVTLSGLGITPIVENCPATADTWHKIEIDVTNPNIYPGTFNLNVSGESTHNANGAYFWIDGIVVTDFIYTTRHYGYLFDNRSKLTVNNIIEESVEATVAAYTGISINHTTGKVTLTANHTDRELYDYCYYNLSQTANLEYSEFFTSTDGVNYNLSYDLEIDGCALSGTGYITMSSNNLTLSNDGMSDIVIEHDAGTHVNIAMSGLVIGSRVQLYNVDTTTELYNEVVAASSITIPVVWTTNQDIRYRVMYVSGATAKEWIEENVVLTDNGLSITVNQADDAIYNSMGIDGSTVSECSITGSALVIDIDDADNTTTAQRLLAFEIYWLSTEGGIRDQNLYIEYADATHLVFTGGLKIKNSKPSTPLSVSGASIIPDTGNPADVIDSTGGSININTDRVVSFNDPTDYLTTVKFLGLK